MINVYSASPSPLGRFLSNFTACELDMGEHGKFASVEAYWHWLLGAGDGIRPLSGKAAKVYGRKHRTTTTKDAAFRDAVIRAVEQKLKTHPDQLDLLRRSYPEELVHAIPSWKDGSLVEPATDRWFIESIRTIRLVLQQPPSARHAWYRQARAALLVPPDQEV